MSPSLAVGAENGLVNCISMYCKIDCIVSILEIPLLYPGVSTKHKFRSRTVSPMLFLRRKTFVSSMSDHHDGYGFVLANTSVICCVVLTLGLSCLLFDFGLVSFPIVGRLGDKGST